MAKSLFQESVKLVGLPGATAGTRYVGATTSGYPTSGSFLVGDFAVDQTGGMWICTASGSPGTWARGGFPINENVAGKNLLINGGMDIAQRGTSIAVGANTQGVYTLDRWQLYLNGGAAAATVTQNTSVVPNTIPKSLKVAVTTADPTPSGPLYILRQFIEADNLAPTMWGTPNAQAITFSFWVYTNLTGTFGFSIQNYASSRFYVTQYTVNTANTWQYITITIPGDTATGYWNLTGNGGSASISFDMGSTYGQTTSTYANAWNAGYSWSIVGNQKVMTSTSNVFYITGVQMEIGNTATAFSRAGGSIGGELALCQRYLPAFYPSTTTDGFLGYSYATNSTLYFANFRVETRIPPTGFTLGGTFYAYALNTAYSTTTLTFNSATTWSATFTTTAATIGGGQGSRLAMAGGSYILFTGCEL